MSEPVNGSVVPDQQGAHDLAPQPADPLANAIDQLRITWCNAPYASDEAQALMLASVGECDLTADEAFGVELPLVAVLIRTVTLTNKDTGEVLDKPRTVFLLEDGRTMSFISIGVLESLSVLASRRPKGVWTPPIVVRLKQISLKNGHRKYVFTLVQNQVKAPEQKGGKRG